MCAGMQQGLISQTLHARQNGRLAERFNAAVLKTAGCNSPEGLNPSPSAVVFKTRSSPPAECGGQTQTEMGSVESTQRVTPSPNN